MKSSTTIKFREAYARLPLEIQRAATKQFKIWQQDTRHHSLQFKAIGGLWSARVTQDYRALAVIEGETCHWIWIGTHAEYDQILKRR